MRNRIGVVVLALSLLLPAGCMPWGLLVDPPKSFSVVETISFPAPRSDLRAAVIETANVVGYSVIPAGFGGAPGSVYLYGQREGIAARMMGKTSTVEMTLTPQEDGRKLEVLVKVTGNFGEGGQAAAERVKDEFKARLVERLATN